MPTRESMRHTELAELIVSVDSARAPGDSFKLPADLRTLVETRLADLNAKDPATLVSESGRAGASINARTSLQRLENLLTDGYNFIKGLGSYAITDAQRLTVFTAYGWESGLIGRFFDDRIEALARQAIAATPAISNPVWRYPAPLLALITAELATLNANQPIAQLGDRQTAIVARDEAVVLLQTANDRVRFFYCSASDLEDRTTELARIGRQPRRPRTNGGGLTAPTGLTLEINEDLSVSADWDEMADVDHFLVLRQRVGIDAEFVEEPASFAESEATIGPFAAGLTVRVKVLAVRNERPGPESAAEEVTLPGSGLPAVPAAPTLTNGPDGQVVADWPDVPGATGFRMFTKLASDPDYVDMGLTTISQATFSSLPIGETFRLKVAARNAAGESAAGPHSEIVVT